MLLVNIAYHCPFHSGGKKLSGVIPYATDRHVRVIRNAGNDVVCLSRSD